MTEAIPSSMSILTGVRPDNHEPVPLLSGYVVAESAGAVSVRVSEGTWTFDRADVLGIDPLGADAGGAVRVRIRRGATADFTRRMRIDLADRPMTLAQQHSPARGDELLARQTERWARELYLPAGPGSGATMTRCQTRSFARGDTVARSDDAMACDNLD
jgi:hypothetical protein